MGFEIPVDVAYFRHPKTIMLQGLLGPKYQADIFPLRLWAWAAEFARQGIVEGGPGAIEGACKWRGRPGALHQALVTARFLDSDGRTIHDWMEHIGRAIAIYEEKKRKMRAKYSALKGSLPEESGSLPPIRDGKDGIPRIGGDTASRTPPPSGLGSQEQAPEPPATSGDEQGPRHEATDPVPTPAPVLRHPGAPSEDPSDQTIIDAVHRWDPLFPVDQIKQQITRAVRIGATKVQLLRDVQELGERLRIWTIVDGYQYPGRKLNGRIRENAPTEKAPVLAERREDVHARQDEARKLADQALADMDTDELDGWKADVEAAAMKAKIPTGPARQMYILSELRKRAGEAYSIKGV